MFSVGEDVEADALFKRGWTVSAIARHLERDRKTVRSYLTGERVPGLRRPARPCALADYSAYVTARFVDDPHLWASALYDEVVVLGYSGAYVSFARQIRLAGLRPHCEACSGVKGRETIEIDHPAGDEIQWDWFERRHASWGETAYVLLGTLSHSGRTRGVLSESMDQAHLVEAMDAVMRRLGGTARKWRTDRLATVIVPGCADVQASFAPVAKHYGAIVTPCPPRRGNRKACATDCTSLSDGWEDVVPCDSGSPASPGSDPSCRTPSGRVGARAAAHAAVLPALSLGSPFRDRRAAVSAGDRGHRFGRRVEALALVVVGDRDQLAPCLADPSPSGDAHRAPRPSPPRSACPAGGGDRSGSRGRCALRIFQMIQMVN